MRKESVKLEDKSTEMIKTGQRRGKKWKTNQTKTKPLASRAVRNIKWNKIETKKGVLEGEGEGEREICWDNDWEFSKNSLKITKHRYKKFKEPQIG